MTAHEAEIKITLLIEGQSRMEQKMTDAEAEIKALKDERNQALKWGVGSLGAAVLAMAAWIFSKFTSGHIS
jgi:hypothetical protein